MRNANISYEMVFSFEKIPFLSIHVFTSVFNSSLNLFFLLSQSGNMPRKVAVWTLAFCLFFGTGQAASNKLIPF